MAEEQPKKSGADGEGPQTRRRVRVRQPTIIGLPISPAGERAAASDGEPAPGGTGEPKAASPALAADAMAASPAPAAEPKRGGSNHS